MIRPEVHADAPGRVIRQVECAVKPPGAVVVPEMVIGSRDLLTAGNNGYCDGVHDGVVV